MPTLYPFQQEFVKRIRFLATFGNVRYLNSDDTGLGKTPETIVAVRESGIKSGYVLVVCGKSLVNKWVKEFRIWWPESDVFPIHGGIGKKARFELLKEIRPHRIVVTNYDTVRIERAFFMNNPPEWIIIDEAHRMKSRKSQLTQVIHSIEAKHRLLLTATPTDGKPFELWALLHYLNPKKYDNFWKFAQKYGIYRSSTYSNWTYVGPRNLDLLQKELSSIMIRRTKEQVLPDLPPVRQEIVSLEMTKEQSKIYHQMVYDGIMLKESGEVLTALNAIAKIVRLKQLAVNPALVGGKDTSPKFDYVEEVLEEATRPIAVFSQFKTAIDLLEQRLKKYRVVRITGDESESERERAYDAINAGKADVCLFTKAGGEGINLTGADHLIFLDKDWSRTVLKQVRDRLHRIGQENPVLITHLVMSGTVEEYIEDILVYKEEISEAMLPTLAMEYLGWAA